MVCVEDHNERYELRHELYTPELIQLDVETLPWQSRELIRRAVFAWNSNELDKMRAQRDLQEEQAKQQACGLEPSTATRWWGFVGAALIFWGGSWLIRTEMRRGNTRMFVEVSWEFRDMINKFRSSSGGWRSQGSAIEYLTNAEQRRVPWWVNRYHEPIARGEAIGRKEAFSAGVTAIALRTQVTSRGIVETIAKDHQIDVEVFLSDVEELPPYRRDDVEGLLIGHILRESEPTNGSSLPRTSWDFRGTVGIGVYTLKVGNYPSWSIYYSYPQ